GEEGGSAAERHAARDDVKEASSGAWSLDGSALRGPHLPGPPLPEGEEGDGKARARFASFFVFLPPLPLGEEGRGGEGLEGYTAPTGKEPVTSSIPEQPAPVPRLQSRYGRLSARFALHSPGGPARGHPPAHRRRRAG